MAKKIRTEKERADIKAGIPTTRDSGGNTVFVVYMFKLDISHGLCGVSPCEVFKTKEDAFAFFKECVDTAKHDIFTYGFTMDSFNTKNCCDCFLFTEGDIEIEIKILEKSIC